MPHNVSILIDEEKTMAKSLYKMNRRRAEAEAVLKSFMAVNYEKYKSDSYTLGYINQMLLNTLAENVSEEVFKNTMEIIRSTTVKNFVRG
jgi:hypothetical protein